MALFTDAYMRHSASMSFYYDFATLLSVKTNHDDSQLRDISNKHFTHVLRHYHWFAYSV